MRLRTMRAAPERAGERHEGGDDLAAEAALTGDAAVESSLPYKVSRP